MKGFVLCAGVGKRLRPLTNYIPKPLVRIGDKTVFERIVEKLIKINIKEIVINLYHLGDVFERFLDVKKFNCDIKIYKENSLLGTGGALKNISDFIDDDLIVHNGDILTDFDLFESFIFHKENKNTVTLCVMERRSSRVVVFDKKMQLCGWINKDEGLSKGRTDGKIYSFSGVYIVSPDIVKHFPKEDTFYLFDFLMAMNNNSVKGYVVRPSYWFDIGSMEKLAKAREFFGLY